MSTTEYALGTLLFTVHNDEFRTSKLSRIVIDETGTNYIFMIDNVFVEKKKHQVDRTKEGLFNKMVDRFSSRQQK
jgi:hypothetical protein